MKVSYEQAQRLSAAIEALNGTVERVTVNGAERQQPVPYKFPAATTLAIVANRKALRTAMTALEEMRTGLIRQIGGPDANELKHSEHIQTFLTAMRDACQDVELKSVPIDSLNLDINAIAPAVIDDLEPMLA